MSTEDMFSDFLDTLSGDTRAFVCGLHDELTKRGCSVEVKSAKSGYVVSYSLKKKTVANYVFRKKGLVARIYANHIAEYPNVLDSLPDSMAQAVREAPVCKRLVDPAACNPKCAMGYDFFLRGERLQRCRNNAFQFFLTEESRPFVKTLLLNEVEASAGA